MAEQGDFGRCCSCKYYRADSEAPGVMQARAIVYHFKPDGSEQERAIEALALRDVFFRERGWCTDMEEFTYATEKHRCFKGGDDD